MNRTIAAAPTICMLLSLAAHASGPDVYANLYPEYKLQAFGQPTALAAEVGNLTTMRNSSSLLSKAPSAKADSREFAWSNSYVGARGSLDLGAGWSAAFDAQVLVNLTGSVSDNLAFRDALVQVEHSRWGRLALGKMDAVYKEYGDRLRFAGLSSSNFISTSGVLSSTGWRSDGRKSFHNRFNRTMAYEVSIGGGLNLAASYTKDPVVNGGDRESSLQSAVLYWRGEQNYLALAAERHVNWLPVSYSASGAPTSGDSLRRSNGEASSLDQAYRLTAEWRPFPAFKAAGDLSMLAYSESAQREEAGRFESYVLTTWQVGVEYAPLPNWLTYAAAARAGAGRCRLTAGAPCSTFGLGGTQFNMGVVHSLDKRLSLFALATVVRNGRGASYGSAPTGASTHIYALGVQYRIR